MKEKLSEPQIREIEQQLSCPSGENGVEVGKKMDQSNIGMTKNSVEFLELQDDNSILEIGHGNCGHLDFVLSQSKGIKYFGLEVSKTMWQEAQKINTGKPAEFSLYDGQEIPFSNQLLDCVITVNTVYFWPNPKAFFTEIERVLKEGGEFVLAFANKSFMKKLPFVGERFKLYDKKDIQKLIEKTNLSIIDSVEMTDDVESKTGEKVLRTYTILKMKRS